MPPRKPRLRTRGEGSLFRRKRGGRVVWVAQAPGRHGKQYTGDTPGEALEKRRLAGGDLARAGASTPLSEYLQAWLGSIKHEMAPRSVGVYSVNVRLHVSPLIGNVPLGKVEPKHIRQVMDAAFDKGLAPATVSKIRQALSKAFAAAVNLELVRTNPVAKIARPKIPKPIIEPLSDEEAKALRVAIEESEDKAFILVLRSSGGRIGEVLSVRWSDLNWQTGDLRVTRTLNRMDDGRVDGFKDTKSDRGRRVIRLPRQVLEALKHHRKKQLARRLKLGENWTDLDLIFPSSIGTPWELRNATRALYALYDKAGIKRETGRGARGFHLLRHTIITKLLREGKPVRAVAAFAGNDPVTLMAHYAHLLGDEAQIIGEAVEGILEEEE